MAVIHGDNQVGGRVRIVELGGPVGAPIVAGLRQLGERPTVGPLAHMPASGPAGIDGDAVGQPGRRHRLIEDHIPHWGAADIAGADDRDVEFRTARCCSPSRAFRELLRVRRWIRW